MVFLQTEENALERHQPGETNRAENKQIWFIDEGSRT